MECDAFPNGQSPGNRTSAFPATRGHRLYIHETQRPRTPKLPELPQLQTPLAPFAHANDAFDNDTGADAAES